MAEILIKIEGNSNALVFVERTQPYLSKTLKEIRQDIISEVGELLPQNFKFVRTGIPVSAIQEEKLHLQKSKMPWKKFNNSCPFDGPGIVLK